MTQIISSTDIEQALIQTIMNEQQQIVCKDTSSEDGQFSMNSENEPISMIDNEREVHVKKESEIPKGYDCVIKIPSIDLEKIVYTGVERELQLEKYNLITASADMKYEYGGNYIICGHDSKIYGHSLNRLDEVKKGDAVYIYYNGRIYTYRIEMKDYECMSNTSRFCEQSEKSQVTIISCAKDIGPDQYIVIRCGLENVELYE